MTADSVSVVINKDNIATLTLDRTKALNAFDRAQVEDFNGVLDGLKVQTGLRALVVRGAGKVFCAGADVRYLRDMGAGSWEQNLADSKDYAGMSKRMRLLSVPVISCVQGGAYGGGIGVVAASDIVISEQNAKFAVTEGRFGFTASIMMPYLLPRIGIRQARRWCLSSEMMSASEASRIGLVDQVVQEGALDDALAMIINDVLRNGPVGIQQTKSAMNYLSFPPFNDETISASVEAFAKGRACTSAQEGAASFLEKRKPAWVE
ncbi:enoyl-CoA hydratase-related protein [Alphaproteobacteria bacterium]|nr:enoyl-CoA hydratase-related protein [Alphaproteobacteria bacterium]